MSILVCLALLFARPTWPNLLTLAAAVLVIEGALFAVAPHEPDLLIPLAAAKVAGAALLFAAIGAVVVAIRGRQSP